MLSARLTGPHILVKGRETTITCPIYDHSALHHATSGTYQILDSSMSVVGTGSCTVVSHTATITTTTTLAYGDTYRVLWTITLTDSSVLVVENELYVVRQALLPVITGTDLYARNAGLNPESTSPHSSYENYDAFMSEAWNILNNRLISKGNRPHLILSNTALREVHILLSLAMIFEDFSSRLGEEWAVKAEAYRNAYEKAWDELNFRYEDDVKAGRRKAARPQFWLM